MNAKPRTGQMLDFDDEARALWERLNLDPNSRKFGQWNPIDSIWRHPVGGGTIFVGNQTAAENLNLLRASGITHVVNCTHGDSKIPNFHVGKLEYLTFPISHWQTFVNNTNASVLAFSEPLFAFIESAIANGNNVLIHCLAGAHRAGTTGVACLVHYAHMDVPTAISVAKRCRPIIDPIGQSRCFHQYGLPFVRGYMIGGPIHIVPGRELVTNVDLATIVEDYHECVNARPILAGYCFLRVLEKEDKTLLLNALSPRQRVEVYQTRAIETAEWIRILSSLPLVGVYKIYRSAYLGEQFGFLSSSLVKTPHVVGICQLTGTNADSTGRPYHHVLVNKNHAYRIKASAVRSPDWCNKRHTLDSSETYVM